jgi:NAD(P)-dependent dehydrogenase (short-subunit alcohol dehydrogenase family)
MLTWLLSSILFVLRTVVVAVWDTIAGLPESFFCLPPFTFQPPPSGQGKWIVVTGAASGIGRALTLRLAQLSWNVIACDINEKSLRELIGTANVHCHQLDVTSAASCKKLAEEVSRRCPEGEGLVALCNVAGIMRPAAILECSDQEIELALACNTTGPIRLMRLLLPALLQGAQGGTILNLSSTGGLDAWPWTGAYTCSKHALEGATSAARREAIANGLPLRVILVEPGAVNTPLAAHQPMNGLSWCDEHKSSVFEPAMRKSCQAGHTAMSKWGFTPSSFRIGYTPEEVAEVCVGALSAKNPRARYLAVRGPFLLLLCLARFLPTELGDAIMSRV